MKKKNEKLYSIVIPVYCNEGSIKTTFNSLKEKVIDRNENCEVIFVDDGSMDNSYEELMELKKNFPGIVRIVKFTRNFGQVPAIIAGYRFARGKCVINLSADLQDPPELINEMLHHYFDEKFEVVICAREGRDESYFRRKSSSVFYKMIKKLSFPNLPDGGFDFVLISDRVKDLLLQMQEANPFWQGQILWPGFKIKIIPYKRLKREIGKSKWTFSKKIKYLIDGVMSYSYWPVRMISILGAITALFGFLYALVIVLARIFGSVPFKGWAPIMILILILSGIQMLMLGVIGEYLWRTLDQVRNRPQYIIDEVHD